MNKSISHSRIFASIILAVFAWIAFAAAGFGLAHADGADYYICYESDGYRVRAVNRLVSDADGSVYTISPTLVQGEKFYISDGAGAMFGNAKGEPLTVVEAGAHRYTVRFEPNADGVAVSYSPYTPTQYIIEVTGADGADKVSTEMEYRRNNAAFEEYIATLYSLAAGDVVTVTDGENVYGISSATAVGGTVDGYAVPFAGDYRFMFTVDEDHLYDGENYMAAEDVPELYVLCAANGFEQNAEYRMTRDEDTVAYAEYAYSHIVAPEKDCDVEFAVYDATTGETFKPSDNRKINVKDKGNYRVLYSPGHAYSSTDGVDRYVALEREKEYYGGYYVLGDFNDYEYEESDEFDELNKLEKDGSVSDYDEYTLTLYVSQDDIDEFGGAVEFYITDGTHIYRRPLTQADIRIDRAGEYELRFSPTHDYGRGYHYRLERVADEIERKTVYIDTAEQFVEYLAACTSPEYSLDKSVVLRRDIDLSGMQITPAAIFAGELDGLYNTVRGIKIDGGDNGAWLFGTLTDDACIKRLSLEVDMKGGDYVAPVRYNHGKISDVEIAGAVEGSSYVGGLVAANYAGGEITGCKSTATVDGTLNVGGVCGFNGGTVETCENAGDINVKVFGSSELRGMLNVGGIAGYSTGTLFGCVNIGGVGIDQARYFGGIAGLASGGIYFCTNGGDVGAENYAGGIVGYYGRFSNNSGNSLSQYLQGTDFETWLDDYFGTSDNDFEQADDSGVREIYYCYNYGDITAENYAGGIAGACDGATLEVVGCVSSATISAKTGYAGGVAGELGAGTVSECVAYGHITVERGSYVGGIVGSAKGAIEYSASAAYVEASVGHIGGIAGSANIVRNCVAHAFVRAGSGEHVGAIAGAAVAYTNNFYPSNGADGAIGIDGVAYGSESGYGACPIAEADIVSEGTLSPALYGLDGEHWLAGDGAVRYPVPRCFADIRKPDGYTQTVKLDGAFENAAELRAAADEVGKTNVTVTFFVWNFDTDKAEWAASYYIPAGSGIDAPTVPDEDGYFTWWSVDDFSRFDEDTVVEMMFDRYATALASDDDAEHPQIIVTGKFYSDSTLAVEYNGEYVSLMIERGGVATDYNGALTVRYRTDGQNLAVKLVSGGRITDAECRVDGGYVIFDLPSGVQFCTVAVAKADDTALVVTLTVVFALFAVVVAAVMGIAIKRIRNA